MKAADLREKSVDELAELYKSLAHDVFQNRLKNFTNRLDDTSLIGKTKRDLARVITLLHEREHGLAVQAPMGADAGQVAATVEASKEPPAAGPSKAKRAKKVEAK